mmetsp:Transcript_3786/g.2822  ORF Transcript_3786/g.2822 Transcript_3786/m.2822 type:complete len:98 (-) Transcript_3786:46-339(-)
MSGWAILMIVIAALLCLSACLCTSYLCYTRRGDAPSGINDKPMQYKENVALEEYLAEEETRESLASFQQEEKAEKKKKKRKSKKNIKKEHDEEDFVV